MKIIRIGVVYSVEVLLTSLFFLNANVYGQTVGNASQAMSVLNNQFNQIGLRVCESKVKKLSEYLMGGDYVNFVLQSIGPTNNGSLTLAIAGINPKTGLRSMGTWTLFLAEYACSGSYEQVISWPQSCAEVKEKNFPSYGPPRYLLDGYFQAELNSVTHAYFFSNLNGCTTVKKEILK
jgi:hypothetical protein